MTFLFDDKELADHLARHEGKIAPIKAPKRTRKMTASKRSTGTVKFYNPARGYGFSSIDESDLSAFIGTKSLVASGVLPSQLAPGARISFRIQRATRGPAATSIRLIDDTETDPERCVFCGGGDGAHIWSCSRSDATMAV
jgi:cold shock CspA family protein